MTAPRSQPADRASTTRPVAAIRADYRAFCPITTRWMDNDVFGHVNNVTYYSFFDTAVTGWLMERGLIGFTGGPMWMVAETGCRFLGEVAFPDQLVVGLRLGRLGNSSVRYELAVFRGDADTASAVGHFVHVHVGRDTRRPVAVPDAIRHALAELQL
jgi:acyl-CoA thioester hydrolase